MIHTAELDTEQVVESEFITESETYLYEHGYRTDTAGYYLAVNHKQDGENSGYIVKAVETTAVPFEYADIVEDSIRILLCSCAAYRYQQGLEELEDRETLEWSSCKHCEAVDKSVKAKNDENQRRLTE
jgi:hypothetical protein